MCRTETPRRGKSGTESGAKQAQPVLAVWNLKFGLVRVLGANQLAANVIAAIFNDLDRLKCACTTAKDPAPSSCTPT